MATFKPHYNLCALLGAHNLVGVSSDKDENSILATLSSNVVVKHKLTDQKPLKSWSTRQSNNLTSPCIYDSHSDKYASVINKKHIILWGDEDTNLEDVKKYTFKTDIHTILNSPGKPSIVLFSNGYSESLEASLDRRKDDKPSLLCPGDVICKAYLENIKDQRIIVIRSNNRVYLVRLANDGTPVGDLHFDLQNNNHKESKILATTVVSQSSISLIALWSDGSLTEYSEQGQTIASHTLKGISLSSPVVMATLDETHIAIYGADVSEEGALLHLFDLKFGMTVATRRLKVFCDPPHLYCHPANSVLLLCVIQNLVVVPFILKPSLLWNLVSGEQPLAESRSKPNVANWGSSEDEDPQIPLAFDSKEIDKLATTLLESNASTTMLFEELIPVLKEKNDLSSIQKVLVHVKDLPEQWLADLLNFALEQIKNYSELSSQPKLAELLDTLLSISYCDAILLNHIRRKLTSTSTIKLLHHLHHLSKEVQWIDDQTSYAKPNMHQIIDWISLILDAHHNELLIIGEDAEVQQLLRNLDNLIARNCEFLDALGHSEALVKLLESNRKPPENRRKDWYAIEVVRLL